MQQKFFIKPFAELGDREAVPNDTQITGDISYEQGYGYDYQRDQATDPLAKPIERIKHNSLFYDITGAVQQYQVCGTPEWITSEDNGGKAYPYTQHARVLYRAKEADPWEMYQSVVEQNTAKPTDNKKWMRIVSKVASEEQARAGTDNSTIMTPLRVAQAVKEFTKEVGQIVFEARTSARAGYLKCNGVLLNRIDYAALWEYAQGSGAMVTDAEWHQGLYGGFSAGDGVTTFRIPDLRGEFIRCWDNDRGIDEGRQVGSWQAGAIEAHNHKASMEEAGTHSHGGTTSFNGEHSHRVDAQFSGGGSANYSHLSNYAGREVWTFPSGNHQHTINADGLHQHAIKIETTGGHETRPSNIALLAMIRY